MKVIVVMLGMAASCCAGEYAVLSTGFRLRVDHHEFDGGTVRLYQTGGGYTEMDASLVTAFEKEVELPAPPAAPAPVAPPPAIAAVKKNSRELVDAAAANNGLPPKFVHSVVAAESAYKVDALSPKGAIGLMQLMPGTAQTYGADPHDPAQNVEAGAAYLRELLIKYNGDANKALAAYNAGPGAVDKYQGVPPYAETRTYVERVLRKYNTPTPPDATAEASSGQ
jgi:soluble lytic murein transglycosylase-like protein